VKTEERLLVRISKSSLPISIRKRGATSNSCKIMNMLNCTFHLGPAIHHCNSTQGGFEFALAGADDSETAMKGMGF